MSENSSLSPVFGITTTLILISTVAVLFTKTWFFLHPLAMVFSFVIYMGNAVNIQRNARNTKLHYTMQLLALGCTIFGFYVIYTQKIMIGKTHFATLHGKIGLLIMVLQCFMNINALIALNLKLPFGAPHKIFGRVVFAIGLIEMFLGLNTMRPKDYVLQGGFILASLFLLFSILKPKANKKSN
eukprot:gene7800-12274_t